MFSIERFGILHDEAFQIVKGAAIGEYSLLLGAGFSLGASNGKGQKLPKSSELADDIKREFSLALQIEGAQSLPVAYEDAIDASSEPDVSKYLKVRLTNCAPSWHSLIGEIAWRRIWTLNIDDLPEAVFASVKSRHINFNEDYRVLSDEDGLQIIYLHGRAKTHSKKIFSIQEYHNAVKAPGDWHTAFFAEYKDRPFIACGASLSGEFDLSHTLRSKNQSMISRGVPSLAVVKDLDEAARIRLSGRLGLIPISASAEDFFAALANDVELIIKQHPDLLPAAISSNDARKFGQQFLALLLDKPLRVEARHDFYAGDEPEWADILGAKNATLSFTTKATAVLSRMQPGVVPIVAIFGDPGCGKSTTLLDICSEMAKVSRVFLFRGEEDIDVEACIASIRGPRSTVLAFDDAADFSVAIAKLGRIGSNEKLSLGILLSDRSRRDKGISFDLVGQNLTSVNHSALTVSDIFAVVQKRRSSGRLGSLTPLNDQEIRKEFVRIHHGNLLSALADIEGGRGFAIRLDELVRTFVGDQKIRALAIVVALTHRWGYPLPIHYASVTSGMAGEEIAVLCTSDGALADVFVLDRQGVRFRHRVLAERFFSRCDDIDLLVALSTRLVEAIAPLVNIQAIRSKSYPHRLSKVLMDRKGVLGMVRGDVDRARKWYAGVEENFGWNSRYWEQRALLEEEAGNLPAAYSHAKLAVDKEPHPFPYTTLGKVCMAYSLKLAATSISDAFEKYREGNVALLEAFAMGRLRPETMFHPVTTFFEYSDKIYGRLKSRKDFATKIRENWADWIENARSYSYFRLFPDQERELQGKLLKMSL